MWNDITSICVKTLIFNVFFTNISRLPFFITNYVENIDGKFSFFKTSNYSFFVCNRGDTVQYHGHLRSRELGQATMLQVFLTPRQALSSHPCQQMVWLYWLQDRDSTLSTIRQHFTHNEIQWPTATGRWHFALRYISHRQSFHLLTPSHPPDPPVWPNVRCYPSR